MFFINVMNRRKWNEATLSINIGKQLDVNGVLVTKKDIFYAFHFTILSFLLYNSLGSLLFGIYFFSI